jgi:hypothetical protein
MATSVLDMHTIQCPSIGTFEFSEWANSTQNRQDTTHFCNLLVIIFLLHLDVDSLMVMESNEIEIMDVYE